MDIDKRMMNQLFDRYHHLNTINKKRILKINLNFIFYTGFDKHGDVINVWHLAPVYIVCAQLHENVKPDAIHCPPFIHGWIKHGFVEYSQYVPWYDDKHWHDTLVILTTVHVPPFWHTRKSHIFIGFSHNTPVYNDVQ